MKLKLLLAVSALSLTTLLAGARGRAAAQAAPPAAPGAAGGIGQMIAGGLNSTDTSRMDPTRSVVGYLLKRDDVRTAILLEQRQREKLDAADKQQQQAQQKAIMDIVQKARTAFGRGQNLSQEEQQAKAEELRTTAETALQNIQKDQDKTLAEILRPEQLARLHELDLQWRGPMAMGDPKLQESMGLTKPEIAVIDAALAEFRTAVRESFQKSMPPGFAGRRGANAQPAPGANGQPANGAAGQAPNGAAGQPANGANAQTNRRTFPSQEVMKQQQAEAQKDLEKARATEGDKILKGLTDAHRQKWESLLGKTFKFRVYN